MLISNITEPKFLSQIYLVFGPPPSTIGKKVGETRVYDGYEVSFQYILGRSFYKFCLFNIRYRIDLAGFFWPDSKNSGMISGRAVARLRKANYAADWVHGA